MVVPRTKSEIELIRRSGEISAQAMKQVLLSIKPGVTGLELNAIATREILGRGGQIAFDKVPGYSWAICVTINEQVVHGIPTTRKLEPGDLVSIDLGAIYQGWYTDMAWSVLVDSNDETKKKFLKSGEEALWVGVAQAIDGHQVGDISNAIQTAIEKSGYSVVRALVGHGVGRDLHEEPEIPGFGQAHTGMKLKTGMSLAIEPIYAQGNFEVELDPDGWTVVTKDRSWGGLFEMTVIVGEKNAEIVTDWRKI